MAAASRPSGTRACACAFRSWANSRRSCAWNGALQVQFAAADDATAGLLREHMPELASALDAVGTPLAGFDARARAGKPDAKDAGDA